MPTRGPTTGTLADHTREIVLELSRLHAWRAAREKEVAGSLAAARDAAEKALAEATEGAARGLESQETEARQAHEAGWAREVAPLDAELAALTKHTRMEESIIRERGASEDAAVAKWLADKLWMAESIFETASPKPGEQFEALRKELASAGERLRALEQSGRARLRACRMPGLPAADASGLGAAGWSEGECASRMKAAAERAAGVGASLGGSVLLGLFGALWPVVVVVSGAGAGAALGGWRTGWTLSPAVWAWTAAGAVASVAVLSVVWAGARKRARRDGAALAMALAEARAAGERWLEIAGDNRRRLENQIRERRDLDMKSAQTKAGAKRDELAKAREAALEALEASSRTAQQSLRARRDAAAAALDATRDAALDVARHRHEQAMAQARGAHERSMAEAERHHAQEHAALAAEWHARSDAAHAAARTARDTASAACPAWDDDCWSASAGEAAWRPRQSLPQAVALGRLDLDLAGLPGGAPMDPALARGGASVVPLPLALELPDRLSLVARTAAQGRPEAIALLQSAMLRLLTAFPPGKVRFTIVDPVGLGQNFSAFMHLADYEPALVSDRIWTEPRHVEQRLTDLTEHMETVIQKYLRNQFATIEAYNAHAGEVAEPYRFLVLADFPSAINELAAKRLASILDSGPRCGVYALIAADTRQPLPQGLTQADLNKCAVRLTWKPGGTGPGARPAGFALDDPDLGKLPLVVEPPPAGEAFNRVVHLAGRHAKDSSRVQVPFDMIAPSRAVPEGAEGGLWSRDSGSSFAVPMGRAGATKLQSITLGRGTAQHALIAGRTGSGKSTLLHAVITNLALWYSPSQVEVYLIDFKKGVEFKTYAAHELPHARVIAIESEREFGLSVLRRLDAELRRRGELFRAAEVQDLAGYRAARPGEAMPRVLLIIDEFQELFVEDDKLAQESSLLLDRLVRQGRAFGMHAILGSQTLGGAYSLARSTIGQMAVRIALQCSEADSYLILSDDNPAARLLSRPGEAIYNDASGAIEGNSPFQVAWLSEEARDAQLDRVREAQARAESGGGARRPAPIIFEGSAPARLERNPELADLLAGRATPSGPLRLWLGEPIAIKEPTAALMRRQSAANVLIVGQRDESALAMFASALIGLAAQTPRGSEGPDGKPDLSRGPRALILDGTPADGPASGTLERFATVLPLRARVVPYREVDATMAELAGELDRRLAADAPDEPPTILMVYGLQRFRSLRRPENEFDFGSTGEGTSPDKHFLRVLREGPAAGVHAMVWADTLATLNRTLERSALREFDQRVLFQMSASDSSALIDVASAGTIGANRALFYSEESGAIEKFRPYAMPEVPAERASSPPPSSPPPAASPR